jgi:hypothetical protein
MAKQSQKEKFKAAAREIGADSSERRFNARLAKLAKQKPSETKTKKRAK